MRVVLDRSACTGHGRCYALGPDVFEADDGGYGTVIVADVPPELEEQARLAEANCPERAITVEAHLFSEAAQEKIKAAGGTVTVIPPKVRQEKPAK